MKIVCDNCSAKYQISDDKVRNKTFKIRCKKCSHVIIVRGGQQDAAAAAPAVSEPEQPVAQEPAAADPDAIWHVVVNREQIGPLGPSQVEAYIQSGDLDAESFVWAEGMPDWTRLGSVPQLAHLVPAPAPAAAAPVPEPAAPVAAAAAAPVAAVAAPMGAMADELGDQTAAQPGGMFPSSDEDDVMASNNVADPVPAPAAVASSGGGMFPSAAADDPPNPRISTASQLRNQRNENSVLFSLDSLAAEVEASKKPRVSNTGGSEASGLIDISALSGLDASPSAGGDDPFGSPGMAMAPAPMAGAAAVQPLVAPSSKNNTGLIVVIALLVLILVGGGGFAVWYVMSQDEETGGDAKIAAAADETPAKMVVGGGTPPPTEKAEAKPAEDEKPAEDAKDGADDEKAAADDEAEAKDDGEEKVAAAPKPARKPARRSRAARSKPAAAPKPAAKPAARSAPARRPAKKESTSEVDDLLGALDGAGGGSKSRAAAPSSPAPAAPAGDPLLPEKLSRRQILTVVKKNARSIQTCKGDEAGGTVKVEIVIIKSGRVSSANVKSGQKGTPVGACVERKVRAFRFPAFSGDPMRIMMPFSL